MDETTDYSQPTEKRPALQDREISGTALSDLFFNYEKPTWSGLDHNEATDDEKFAAIFADAKAFVDTITDPCRTSITTPEQFAHEFASDFWHRL